MITTQEERVAIRKIAAETMIRGRCKLLPVAYLTSAVRTYSLAHRRVWDQAAIVREVGRKESLPNTAALVSATFWD